jgi:heat shock protein HtpX
MAKRIVLFLITNLLVMIAVGVIFSVFGLDRQIGGQGNLVGLLIFSAIFGFAGAIISLLMSRTAAKWMTGAKPIDPDRPASEEERWVLQTTYRLAEKAGMKAKPEVAIYESPEVNAFATGPSQSRSLVAVSRGLLGALTRDEVEAVIAHEVAHIKNGDMVTMTLLQGVVNTFAIFLSRLIAQVIASFVNRDLAQLAYFAVSMILQIVFMILGNFVVAAFSRYREFHADSGSAALAGPEKMIAALQRLRQQQDMVDTSQPALATMKIAGGPKWLALLSTHPPLEARIAALQRFGK